ncbi:MAG: 50S ribosomal protein L3, partial [Candidatus Aenigmatarchaeota archaeon]
MAKHNKPVAGSRAYWPKKRAKRIYPRARTRSVKSEETLPLAFAGYKAGMIRIAFINQKKESATEGEEVVKPVTILDCPSLRVCAIQVYRKSESGLKLMKTIWAEKLSKDLERKLKVPKKVDPKTNIQNLDSQIEKMDDVRLMVHTQPRESGIGKKKPEIFEIGLGGDVQKKWEYAKGRLGGEIKASEVFKNGEWVDVSAVDKGKGYQGHVKRFGVIIRSRKNKGKRRHTGVIGVRGVARVLPGKIAMAGQLGFQTRTEFNKVVIRIGSEGINPGGGWLNYGVVKGDYLIL